MKDIILLALSTLPQEKRESSFMVEGDDYQGKYFGQLEPVVLYKLSQKSNNPTEIIALCTDKIKNDTNNFSLTSAFDYFCGRVKEMCADAGLSEEIEITSIDISETNPISGITDTVKHIRNAGDIGELWIDTHGGFRDISLNLEAVISLLKVDNIVPDRIFGIRYDKGQAVLTDQKNSFGMFDFVSGMNEFIQYGSVDILNKYYESHKEENLEPILDAMNTVSNGTKECNPTMYVEGLDKLGESVGKLNDSGNLLGIFEEYIRSSYGILLDKKNRTAVDIIRHCIDKGLHQQALTFLETLMPAEFVRHEILYYDSSELEELKRKNPKLKPGYESDDNFVINSYVTSNNENSLFSSSSGKIPPSLNEEKEYIEILTGKRKNSPYRPARSFLDPSKAIESKKINLSKTPQSQVMLTVRTKVGANDWWDAGKIMRMHKALKRCRNSFNHCDSDRAETEDIVMVIRQYIDIADKLLSKYQ